MDWFDNVPNAKSLWAVIKSRFGGNEESKKMQKFENFVTLSNETLDKAYDSFQKLISQLEIHGSYVLKEDINQKFLRSLPPLWSQIALIMRNKLDIDEIDIDDLYNNLRNTSSTNEVSTGSGDFGVSTAGGINQMDRDDLEELDLQWQVAMLTVRVKKKGHFARECRSGRSQGRRPYGDNGRGNAKTTKSSSHELVAQDGLGGYD
ncbi:hypothetical protein Tco_0180954 [Tanacetum coccineum]